MGSHTNEARTVVKGIEDEGGKFIRHGNDVFVILGNRRIAVTPDFKNQEYAALQLKYADVGTAEAKGRAICQRVAVFGGQHAENVRVRRFSALSSDGLRLYIPGTEGNLLQLSRDGISIVPNGTNQDGLWLEHPEGTPFSFDPQVNTRAALGDFERLCVDTIACNIPEHAWLLAMHEGLLPYLRDCVSARMLVEHLGPSQHGKTTAAERFVRLHGLGEVLGDITVAYLRNCCDGIGLAALDNKEQANYKQDLIDFLLFAATGGRHGRSTKEGAARELLDRPIVALTSIEGLFKGELQNRTISVRFGRLADRHRDRDAIEREIKGKRNAILSGVCCVLCRFLRNADQNWRDKLPSLANNCWTNFQGYVETLASLLFAYGEETGRDAEWVDRILQSWFETIVVACNEREEDVFETHIEHLLQLYDAQCEKSSFLPDLQPAGVALLKAVKKETGYHNRDEQGSLYVTSAGELLNVMQMNRIGVQDLPKTAHGMRARIDSTRWVRLRILDEQDDPRKLRRSSQRRPIGIFRPDDVATEVTSTEENNSPCVTV